MPRELDASLSAWLESVTAKLQLEAGRELAECVRLVAASHKPTWRERVASALYEIADWIYPPRLWPGGSDAA